LTLTFAALQYYMYGILRGRCRYTQWWLYDVNNGVKFYRSTRWRCYTNYRCRLAPVSIRYRYYHIT